MPSHHPIDTAKRRARTRRHPLGKRLAFTARDLRILQWLYRYRYLDTYSLVALCKPKSEKRFIERLGDLYHETGWIERPAQQWQHGWAFQKTCIYSLSKSGAEHLARNAVLPLSACYSSHGVGGRTGPQAQFDHAFATCQFLASQEAETLRVAPVSWEGCSPNSTRFVPIEEILNKRQAKYGEASPSLAFPVQLPRTRNAPNGPTSFSVVPDGLFGLEYRHTDGKHTYRFMALEMERTSPLKRRTLAKSSTFKKLLAYQAALHSRSYQSALGIPNLFPVFVGQDQEHCAAIAALAESVLTAEELALFRFEAMNH